MSLDNTQIDDLNIRSIDVLVTPAELRKALPMSLAAHRTVAEGRQTIRNILDGKDHTYF